jgi:ADP-heptose:LPS heptosyltransferase
MRRRPRALLSVSALRALDWWVGVPLCFALTLVRYTVDAVSRRQRNGAIARILFLKLAEQGSTVLAYTAIESAVNSVGRANVYFLVFEQNRPILDLLDILPRENVVTISQKNVAALFATTLRAVARLHRLRLDAIIDLEFFARGTALLAYLCGARHRVGLHSYAGEGPYRGDLLTHRVVFNPHIHTSQTFQVLVKALDVLPGDLPALNVETPPRQTSIPLHVPTPDDLSRVRRLVREGAGTDVHTLVLLNPNASDLLPLRRWPTSSYVELAKRLLHASPDLHLAVTGSPDERPAAEDLARAVADRRCFSVAGRTTLRELLALFTLADAMVTNDSGPALFATMTRMRVVTLFGPETPLLFASNRPGDSAVWARLPCSPCVNAYNNRRSKCRDNVCMQQISVSEVLRALCRGGES